MTKMKREYPSSSKLHPSTLTRALDWWDVLQQTRNSKPSLPNRDLPRSTGGYYRHGAASTSFRSLHRHLLRLRGRWWLRLGVVSLVSMTTLTTWRKETAEGMTMTTWNWRTKISARGRRGHFCCALKCCWWTNRGADEVFAFVRWHYSCDYTQSPQLRTTRSSVETNPAEATLPSWTEYCQSYQS